uniref:Oxidoreductase n=1 Tax=Parastrongyloides trichosuri TaxID=131310 RepID=A0A0N5A5Z5_PARTI
MQWGGGPRSGGGAYASGAKRPVRLVGFAADPSPHCMGRKNGSAAEFSGLGDRRLHGAFDRSVEGAVFIEGDQAGFGHAAGRGHAVDQGVQRLVALRARRG